MLDEDAIAARLSETTAGPWQRHGADVHSQVGLLFSGQDGSGDIRQQADADAEFVAHAPSDVADLLTEVQRLRQRSSDAGADQEERQLTAAELAGRIGDCLLDRQEQMAVAESLTGGRLAAELASVGQASKWFRGGVVAYQPETKQRLLNVAPGPVVTREVAERMAEGVSALLDAELAISVTGVGGPDPDEGKPAGTVWMAVRYGGETVAELAHLPGDPATVCDQTCRAVLALALQRLQ